ncbi:MAG: Coenzyme F420 hydrogenase/dehydrogenase, beta subunit C-terminal domain [Candidatus Lokiarchaeota archaeon]|nr:Coenzyme F420 hydrogenase/dehydrogenase, beta subunit C-terminal domain [Candidatus Lokiarchaeota archaeon]
MSGTQNGHIAFDDLEREIIAPGYCTFCGACEAICPVHAIKVENNKVVQAYDCSEHLDSCPICYEICPHTGALLSQALQFVADAPLWGENIGYYRKILLARSTDEATRHAGKGGGVIASLLTSAIKDKLIDSAVVSQSGAERPLDGKPSIINVPDDLLSAVDARFIPSPVAQAFGQAVYEHGKSRIAFVGVPCHVMSLRKLEAFQHKIVDSLKVTIGLSCLWAFSMQGLLRFICYEYGIESQDITEVDLEEDNQVITTVYGENRIPFSELKSHIMNRCRTCGHFTSHVADLSVGGATPLKDWSVVIVRTKAGEEFLDAAVASGAISVKDIHAEPKALEHLEKIARHKRKDASREIAALRKSGRPVPAGVDFLFTRDRKDPA